MITNARQFLVDLSKVDFFCYSASTLPPRQKLGFYDG
jgi:hypothetical protein